jgi:hypothetical protein
MDIPDIRLHLDGLAGDVELAFPVGRVVRWSAVDRLWLAWDEAATDADLAYQAWSRESTATGYCVYRAAQDRADAAQDALARCCTEADLRAVVEWTGSN